VKEWLIVATDYSVTVIDGFALIIIVVGAAEAFFRGLWTMLASASGHERRDVWLRFARWLVAGLTLRLGAEILETAVTESWGAVGRIAAIAAIRTFLNFFLERDLGEIRRSGRDRARRCSDRSREIPSVELEHSNPLRNPTHHAMRSRAYETAPHSTRAAGVLACRLAKCASLAAVVGDSGGFESHMHCGTSQSFIPVADFLKRVHVPR
jgi:uncharacterized membrane protein